MEGTLVAFASILIGVAATFMASRHYYRRSVDKELTPFIQLQSNVLSRIDHEVKSDLHIKYKGIKVDNLQQVQFLIANTGERAIRDIIKPLNLELPDTVEVMDAAILHTFPEGREVSLTVSESDCAVSFDFALLNKDEFFIFKLLLKGEPNMEELEFSIVADDLPPRLGIRRLGYGQIEREEESERGGFELGLFGASLAVVFLSFCLALLARYVAPDSLPAIQSTSLSWANSIPFISIASIVGYVLSGFLGLIGSIMMFASVFGEFEFPKSKKFKLPKELATASYGFRYVESGVFREVEPADKSSSRGAGRGEST